ncbi:MAG: hypothetical protein H3C52_07050 [Anaerolineales bacterium]|nr:hypothetical protein [Anaerolineales bacterium]
MDDLKAVCETTCELRGQTTVCGRQPFTRIGRRRLRTPPGTEAMGHEEFHHFCDSIPGRWAALYQLYFQIAIKKTSQIMAGAESGFIFAFCAVQSVLKKNILTKFSR